MNADGLIRMMDRAGGGTITLTRYTGTQRVPFSVSALAAVVPIRRRPSDLVTSVTQSSDLIVITDRELQQCRFPVPPRNGDGIKYDDGTETTIDGRVETYTFDDDKVYIIRTVG